MKYIDICTTIYSYTLQNDEELSFKANDVLYILDKENPDWYKAKTVDNKVGYIPSNYVDKKTPIGSVKALYDYEARAIEELDFKQGAILTLYENDDPDWYLAESVDGQLGLVPGNYVKSEPRWAVALYHFNASENEELALTSGDRVFVLDYEKQDWWLAKSTSGATGLVPAAYLAFQDQSNKDSLKFRPTVEKKPKHLSAQKNIPKAGQSHDNLDKQKRQPQGLTEENNRREQQRLAEENNRREQQKLAEENTRREQQKLAEENTRREQQKLAEENTRREQQKLAEENTRREQQKLAEENTRREQQKLAEENTRREQQKLAEENTRREQQKLTEENTRREQQKLAEENTRREQQKLAEENIRREKEESVRRERERQGQHELEEKLRKAKERQGRIEIKDPLLAQSSRGQEETERPNPAYNREWTDDTGTFKIHAQLISCSEGKVRLFKTNGVKIEVPIDKLCREDLRYIEKETGCRQWKFSWLDYFKRLNIPQEAAERYAQAFELQQLNENHLGGLGHPELMMIGMTKQHASRLLRFLSSGVVDRKVRFGPVEYIEDNAFIEVSDDDEETQWQIDQDEKLARMLQEEENQQRLAGGLQRRGKEDLI